MVSGDMALAPPEAVVDAKAYLRIEHGDEDALIASLLAKRDRALRAIQRSSDSGAAP